MGALGNAIDDNLSPAGRARQEAVRAGAKFNEFLNSASGDIWNRATKLADKPYQPYTGQRVADLSGNEMQGENLAATEGQQGQQYANLAAGQINNVANNSFSGDNIGKYMNPYTDAVTNKAIRKTNEASAQNLAGIQGNAASQGAFGGARTSLLEGQNEKNRLQTIGDETATGNANAYQSAIETWKADNNRSLDAAQAYQAVGNDVTRMNSQQVSDLMATGGASRVLDQMKLDVNYNAFTEARDYDKNNLGTLMSALGAARGNTSSPYGLPEGKGNIAGQALGAISAIAGYFGKNSGSGNLTNQDWSNLNLDNQSSAHSNLGSDDGFSFDYGGGGGGGGGGGDSGDSGVSGSGDSGGGG